MPSEFGIERQPPTGLILMWAGDLSDIPSGWALCDGNNGTPNMLNRFVESVSGSNTDPGATGGDNIKGLSTSQLPPHSHNHDGTTSTDGEHRHSFELGYNANEGGDEPALNYGSGTIVDFKTTDSRGDHGHSGNVSDTGSGSGYNNKPRYYELAFIQKL